MYAKTILKLNQIRSVLDIYKLMTLRQIHYQLIGFGYKYRNVGTAVKTGREQGIINYNEIVDRSRPSYGVDTWLSKKELNDYYSKNFKLDYWKDETHKVEIWSEKDALSQIILREAEKYRVPVRVTRGFNSISCLKEWDGDKTVLYFGDHDPSGLWVDKAILNTKLQLNLVRIGLTKKECLDWNLPSIPIKETDADGEGGDPRSPEYKVEHGDRCWELDSLNPTSLRLLIRGAIEPLINFDLEQKRREEQEIRDSFKA